MCPPCKIILDCGVVLPAALRLFASATEGDPISATARYYADVAEGSQRTILRALRIGYIQRGSEEEQEAHAWSELSCHRARYIKHEALVTLEILDEDAPLAASFADGAVVLPPLTAALFVEWADAHQAFATRMIGGEYRGAWNVNGVEGITKRER